MGDNLPEITIIKFKDMVLRDRSRRVVVKFVDLRLGNMRYRDKERLLTYPVYLLKSGNRVG